MDIHQLSQSELNTRCAWCHKVIPEDEECLASGAKVNGAGKRMLEGKEGTITVLKTHLDREVIAIVPTRNSKARSDGYDIVLQVCSEACAANAETALRS